MKEKWILIYVFEKHHSYCSICEEEDSEIEQISTQQGFIIAAKLISLTSIGEDWGSELARSMIDSPPRHCIYLGERWNKRFFNFS